MLTTTNQNTVNLPLWSKLVIGFVLACTVTLSTLMIFWMARAPREIKNIKDLSNAPAIANSLAQFNDTLSSGYKIDLAISFGPYNVLEFINDKLSEKIVIFWSDLKVDLQNKLQSSYNIGLSTPAYQAKFIKKLSEGSLNVANEKMFYIIGTLEDINSRKQYPGLVGCINLTNKNRIITLYACQDHNQTFDLESFQQFLKCIVKFNYNKK